MDATKLTAIEIRDAVCAKKLSARDAVSACLDRIAKFDNQVKAFNKVDHEGALAAADAVDQKIAKGENPGKLAGVPVAVKDNICIKGLPATCSSKMLENFVPPYNAHVAERLQAEGAVVIGKTNLDEFAMGSSTENSAFHATRNPWDTARIPGGSSGGSAAAVAAGFAPLSLGSDTGGSIRQPASLCGCVGFKPTYGMVSRWGLIAFGSSLDQIGPFARTIGDAALLMDCISGNDVRDATSRRAAAPDFSAALKQGAGKLRIGLPKEYFGEGLNPEVEAAVRGAVKSLEKLGAQVKEISLPHTKYAVPVYYVVATAEASSNLARFDGVHYGHRTAKADDIISLFSRSRAEGFGPEVKRRIMLGTYVLSAGYYDAYYLRALKVRTLIARDFAEAFKEVDLIAAPTSPTTAFAVGEKADDPLAMYLSDIYTISANLAGIPAVSVPCGADGKKLPVGMQLMGANFDDARLLAAASAIEQASGWANRVAPLA